MSRFSISDVVWALWLVLCTACSTPTKVDCVELSFKQLVKEQYEIEVERIPGDWPDAVMSCKLGDYVVLYPRDSSASKNFMVLRTNSPVFLFQDGVSALFEDGRPIIDASDRDDDGSFDSMTYTIYYDGLADHLTVADREFDGQLDYKIHYKKGEDTAYWVWVEDGWYRQPKLSEPFVVIDDALVEIKLEDGRSKFVR